MVPHDILTLYATKPVEYLIAVAFLILFVPFWRYVHGGVAARAPAVARRALVPRLVEWFAVPEDRFYHPGHAWARPEPDGVVTVGIDDFARKLVGPLDGVELPPPGVRVGQGEPAWTLVVDGDAIPMLSPVDGFVVAVNPEAFRRAQPPDPYGRDWLIKVKPERLVPNLRTLLANGTARRWIEQAADALRARLPVATGLVYQDGGVPVDGMARAIDPDRWPQVVREFFLTEA
jgi:glycine cleavage system H protein